jgi:hypothetical protein
MCLGCIRMVPNAMIGDSGQAIVHSCDGGWWLLSLQDRKLPGYLYPKRYLSVWSSAVHIRQYLDRIGSALFVYPHHSYKSCYYLLNANNLCESSVTSGHRCPTSLFLILADDKTSGCSSHEAPPNTVSYDARVICLTREF